MIKKDIDNHIWSKQTNKKKTVNFFIYFFMRNYAELGASESLFGKILQWRRKGAENFREIF